MISTNDYNSENLKRKSKKSHIEDGKKYKKKQRGTLQYEKMYRDAIIFQGSLKDIDEEERELEKAVFGDESNVIEQLEKSPEGDESCKDDDESDDGEDEEAGTQMQTTFSFDETEDVESLPSERKTRKAAWDDKDDDEILVSDKYSTYNKCHRSVLSWGNEKYKEFAREKFTSINPTPKWADLDMKGRTADSDADSEEELLQRTGNFTQKSVSLPKGTIDIRRTQDLTSEDAIIKSVEFHSTSRVALVAAYSGTTTLYQVDGKNNPKIQSVHFEKFPIFTARFSVCGNEIVAGSKFHGHYYIYDMIAGKIVKVPWDKAMGQMNVQRFHMSPDGKLMVIHGRFGNIHVISAKTKEWIDTLKMNGEVVAIAFNRDGTKMFSHGASGEVYVWNMQNRTCTHKFTDEGCITGTSLAVSPNDQYLATGSDSGVVNIYEMSNLVSSSNPKPQKVLMNLTTEISQLKFNCTSELMAMSSSHKPEAIKLVHFPSMTVYSNFPNIQKKLKYINSLDISPNSGFFMMGNNHGRAYLYRLRHYSNY